MYMMDDVSYQAAYHNRLKLFMKEHYFFFNQRALPGGVVRVSDWFPKVGGSNPSLGHVHDGRCFLPGSPTH